MAMENVHSEVYSLLIDTLVVDPAEKERLFQAVRTIPAVAENAAWALRWITHGTFVERLVAFACVEGIMFSASFCAIFWLKSRGLCLHALGKSNEFIARDEGQHRDFALLLYRRHVVHKLPPERFREIVRSAVDVEHGFVRDSMPENLLGMNADLMCAYVEFVADHLLVTAGLERMYGTANPFAWIEAISLEGQTNFFEARVSEYAKQQTERVSIEQCFDAEF